MVIRHRAIESINDWIFSCRKWFLCDGVTHDGHGIWYSCNELLLGIIRQKWNLVSDYITSLFLSVYILTGHLFLYLDLHLQIHDSLYKRNPATFQPRDTNNMCWIYSRSFHLRSDAWKWRSIWVATNDWDRLLFLQFNFLHASVSALSDLTRNKLGETLLLRSCVRPSQSRGVLEYFNQWESSTLNHWCHEQSCVRSLVHTFRGVMSCARDALLEEWN